MSDIAYWREQAQCYEVLAVNARAAGDEARAARLADKALTAERKADELIAELDEAQAQLEEEAGRRR